MVYCRNSGIPVFVIIDDTGIELSEEKTTITRIPDTDFYNSFGLKEILSTTKGIFAWTVKIISVLHGIAVWIAISSSCQVAVGNGYSSMEDVLYMVSNNNPRYKSAVGDHDPTHSV